MRPSPATIVSAASVAMVCLVACGPSEADRARDRAAVERVLAADVAVAGELRKADGELAAGDRETASTTVKSKVIPRADANVVSAEALRPITPWGKARAADVTTLVRERRKSLDAYATALAGDDGNALLAAIESQKLVEKRALSVWQGLERPDQ
jgi:hypothetical protein